MSGNTFIGGVVPGGLTDDKQIRILVCYLVSKRQNKLTSADVIEILTNSGLANYFECGDAVSDMLNKGNITEELGTTLGVSASGTDIADNLADDVPLSVRERALSEADALLSLKTNIGQHKVEVEKLENGYNVKCTIADLGTPVFVMELYAPTAETANRIKHRFVQYGAKIYGDALEILTQDD